MIADLKARAKEAQSDYTGAPADFGAFVVVGVWWLLREIECSALTLAAVSGGTPADAASCPASLSLGATKTDIQGRGALRSHRCLCGTSAAWAPICPACALRAQVARRRAAGASDQDPLFQAAGAGDWCDKRPTVELLRARFTPEAEGAITGHSMRRTGAQLLTASGVEPWFVEWFGRWGSSAIRAYIEDARALAPASSGLAMAVAGARAQATPDPITGHVGTGARAGSGSSSSLAPAAAQRVEGNGLSAEVAGDAGVAEDLARLRAELSDLRGLIQDAAPAGTGGAAPEFVLVRYALGKAHVAFEVSANGPVTGRVALCGWSFGRLPPAVLSFGLVADLSADGLCRRCARSASHSGVGQPECPVSVQAPEAEDLVDAVSCSEGDDSSSSSA